MTGPNPTQSAEFVAFANALTGQYQLEREIGRGGMGVVYLARDLKLDRLVAIKTLPPHLAADSVVRERFLREARTAGALSNQNIVPIHRADELGGQVFFVMGYVGGESLAQRIRTRGRVNPVEVLRILRDVADALGYAHSRGIVHRDVKAENILLDEHTGRAMVTDFGIARLAEATPLTSTGQLLGTVYYLSPEQVTGEGVDARSDIYALGVVGYFALSGRFPFNAELASAVLIAHVTKTAPPLHEIAPNTPRALTDIIDRCLLKNPDDRFQNCLALRTALSNIENLVIAEVSERHANDQPLPPQALLSDTEARDILERAANLQAATGIQDRPAPVVGARDPHRHVSETSGHRLGNVRDAAVEAGISSKYVDHALLEHGLTPAGLPAEAPLALVDRSKPPSTFAGATTQHVYEIVVDGEMPEDDFDLLVDIIRQATNEVGQLSAVGRSFTWQSTPAKGNVHVAVLPRGGKTTIRVSENMRVLAAGLFGGIMGGVGGGTSTLWVATGIFLHNPIPAFLGWSGTLVLTYSAARLILTAASRKRQGVLRALTEQLAVQARESIAAAGLKLGSSPAPRLRG
ncbi:MAG: putative serine/threonine protein kinase [Gemmatimonadetes bacterium]|nr:putative serine/threonine protein kinase [Gemmatimonadota bacterium]